jgi:hypothetical protein
VDRLRTGEPVWDLTFDEKARLTAPAAETILDGVRDEGVTDLFIFSHGWNTSADSAKKLYKKMFPLIREAARGPADLGPIGFAGVYWPSLWFPDTPATPPPRVGSTQAEDGVQEDASAGTAALSGTEIATSLQSGFEDSGQQEAVLEIGRLIDEGTAIALAAEPDTVKEDRLRRIHELLTSLMPAASDLSDEDAGETTLRFSNDPKDDYQTVADVFGSAPPGPATQGIGDWFSRAINGAKDALRILSYTIMKARAGTVGRDGLGPLLAGLHDRAPGIRVHLIGHSFGARLVSFALPSLGTSATSPVASLVLLQGAFSHWTFSHAQDNPFGKAGALHTWADRVHGPLVATFSSHDWALCRWYPKASCLARQDQSANGLGRWDGMGADGFQAVTPSADVFMPAEGGLSYEFTPGTFYRVNAATVINDVRNEAFGGAHSDISKLAVAQLVVAAARAHS